MIRTSKRIALLLVLACLYLQAGLFIRLANGQSNRLKTPPASHSPTPSPTPSPSPSVQPTRSLTEIGTGLDDLQGLLQEIKRGLATDDDRTRIDNMTKEFASQLQASSNDTDELLASLPSLPELQDVDSEWRALGVRIANMDGNLLSSATILNNDQKVLDAQHAKWSTILAQIQSDPSLGELQNRIRLALEDIESTRLKTEDQLKFTVIQQTRVAENEQSIKRVQDRIDAERMQMQRGLFHVDSDPLWHVGKTKQSDEALQRVLSRHFSRDWNRLLNYLAANQRYLIFASLAALVALVCALKMRSHLQTWTDHKLIQNDFSHVFTRSYSFASFVGLVFLLPLLSSAPSTLRGILALLMAVPVIRLFGPMIKPAERTLLYVTMGSVILVSFFKMIAVSASIKRVLLALLALAIAGTIAFLSRQLKMRDRQNEFSRFMSILSIRVGITLLLVSFVTNVLGFFALSQVLSDTVLIGAYYAVVIYTAKEVLSVVFQTLLRTDTARVSNVVRSHGPAIGRWLAISLTFIAVIIWLPSITRLLTIRDDLVDIVRDLLSKPLVPGTTGLTGGDLVHFVAVLLIGFVVATAVRVLLREDILRRFPVRHGVPFAISMLTYYVLMLFIFIMALLSAGVELSKFTLFTGAFGIGVGFGLQNTINNFASGLILLFERPIRQHDILEGDGAFGEVTRIGMRSTSIRTAQEAEVIVPNSNLVAGKVINWSRLGRRRPVELPVRVAYGTNPQMVIDLLVKTAESHSDVLRDPAPAAFLQRFGEKSLEFTLVFWVGRYHLDRKVLSEVAISVSDAFVEADIQIPVDRGNIHT